MSVAGDGPFQDSESALPAKLRWGLADLTDAKLKMTLAEGRIDTLEVKADTLERARLDARLCQLEETLGAMELRLARLRDDTDLAHDASRKALDITRDELSSRLHEQARSTSEAWQELSEQQRGHAEELGRLHGMEGRLDAVARQHAALEQLVGVQHEEAVRRADQLSAVADKIQLNTGFEISEIRRCLGDTNRRVDVIDSLLEAHDRHLQQLLRVTGCIPEIASQQARLRSHTDNGIATAKTQLEQQLVDESQRLEQALARRVELLEKEMKVQLEEVTRNVDGQVRMERHVLCEMLVETREAVSRLQGAWPAETEVPCEKNADDVDALRGWARARLGVGLDSCSTSNGPPPSQFEYKSCRRRR